MLSPGLILFLEGNQEYSVGLARQGSLLHVWKNLRPLCGKNFIRYKGSFKLTDAICAVCAERAQKVVDNAKNQI